MTATPQARINHVRIERGDNAFTGLTHEQRVRLMVQVLCGLVAYDERPTTADELTDRLAS